ncbi:increased DNA methylation 1-like [Vicia villosa]|uniref:increased DNA methylation 1-like n=1 Tax=Vicia villosa TaxID=3911 RepID=UPI00273B215E|nr:increased DNA methylation 1-like [Vicia villosa]
MKFSAAVNKSQGKITRKDQSLHKLVFQALEHNANVTYIVRGEKLLDGKIDKDTPGIMCSCCNNVVSPSTFEAHAGWASRRKPYRHIFAGEVSLHELSISMLKKQTISVSTDSDGRCSICEQGGHLLCCDGCPRAFHLECVPLETEPGRIWYCKYCCHNVNHNEKREGRSAKGRATRRVSGKRARRGPLTVNDLDIVDGGCQLCREDDFELVDFGPRTVIICDQCNKEFHIGCLKDHKIENLEKLPEGDWFCGSECLQVRAFLQNLVNRGDAPVSDSLLSLIKKKREQKGVETDSVLDVKWRILNWKLLASEEIRALLSKAVAIFHEQFDPIVDAETGADFIPSMLYARTLKDQYFGGMYCAVLTVNQKVVCAGTFRLFGREVAELPLVATHGASQGKGYFQALLACIQGVLGELRVGRLFLPAAHEAKSLWTRKYGFMALDQDEMNFITRLYRLMMFKGAALLQKPVPRPVITECVEEDPFEEGA